MIFVAVFILQWWTLTLYNIWGIFAIPPPPVLILAVIFINLGGIYNSIAYTIIRRRLQNQRRLNAVVSNGDNVASTTDTNSSISRVFSDPSAVHVSRVSLVPEILPDVLNVSSYVLTDPGFDSQVMEARSVAILPDTDAGEKQDVERIHVHIHM